MEVTQIRRENLRELAKSVGGISKLAVKLHKSQSQISHIIGISPLKKIGEKIASQVEAAFGQPAGWLSQAHSTIPYHPPVYTTPDGQSALWCRPVPLITWQMASQWHRVASSHPLIDSKNVVTSAKVSPLAFALRAEDDAMQASSGKSVLVGAVVIADPDEVARQGDFIVVTLSAERNAVLRQLVSDGNKRYLKPLNPHYPLVELKPDMLICAVVKQVIFDL